MRIIKTIGMQYISDDAVPAEAPPDANRPAQFLNTATGFYYNWNIPTQAWVPIPKVYRARLSQSGVSDPVATVLENTLGVTIVWTRINTGLYLGTLSDTISTTGFTLIGSLDFDASGVVSATASYTAGNSIGITTKAVDESPVFMDGLLLETAFQLLVYP